MDWKVLVDVHALLNFNTGENITREYESESSESNGVPSGSQNIKFCIQPESVSGNNLILIAKW